MGMAPYQRSYQRARNSSEAYSAGYVANPASHLTDQGGGPQAADLAWCIRRQWRVIFYSARQAAGLPLWDGVDVFEDVMANVLAMLSSGFKPVAPIRRPKVVRPEHDSRDRVFQPSCRVFRSPSFGRRERRD